MAMSMLPACWKYHGAQGVHADRKALHIENLKFLQKYPLISYVPHNRNP